MPAVVAIVSLKGGVGRTTLTANLAGALAQAGRRCLAVDLDRQNALAGHFGGASATEAGAADLHLEMTGTDRREAAGRGEPGLVPYGAGFDRAGAVEEKLAADATWLARRLEALAPRDCEVVLLDTPAQQGPWLTRALELADLVLVVVTPDPACYATLPVMEELLIETRGERPGLQADYVVNRFEATSLVGRDVVSALRGSFPRRLAPVLIHDDEAVREAIGRQRTVFRENSHSQVIADVSELAEWLLERLAARTESPPLRAAGARS
jgi:cellulose synthase operon protein YhjQ